MMSTCAGFKLERRLQESIVARFPQTEIKIGCSVPFLKKESSKNGCEEQNDSKIDLLLYC